MDGDRLRTLRTDKGLTQQALGDIIGVSGSTIRMIEINKRNGSLDVSSKLADFFDVSIDYLEGRTEYQNSNDVASSIIKELIGLDLIAPANHDTIVNVISEYINKKELTP